MEPVQRVLVYVDGVAMAGIEASLRIDTHCEVLSRTLPLDPDELRTLHPAVVLFDLDGVPPEFVYAVSRELPGLLLIGIDLETNCALLWTNQRAEGLTSHDLSQVVRDAR